MKCAMITELTGPDGIRVMERDAPTAGPKQVVVEVAAAGVNFPDLLMSRGLYQIKPPLPFAPGGEYAGTVVEVGADVDSLAPGDRVMGMGFYGAFCQLIAADPKQLTRIPDAMDFDTAAAFAFTYGTSYHALVDRGRLQAGESLLVLGAAGGVGLSAVEIGAALGARVIAAASTTEKLDLACEHGAAERINYVEEDLKKRAKALGPRGVDVVYDPVGGAFSEAAFRALKPEGRHLVIGFAAGEIPALRLNLALLKQAALVGVAWGAWALRHPDRQIANMSALFALWAEGKLRPAVTRRYRLAETADALRDLEGRRVLGKVVIHPGE